MSQELWEEYTGRPASELPFLCRICRQEYENEEGFGALCWGCIEENSDAT
jgi:hypothetical protein